MNDAHRRLIQGVVIGVCLGAGAVIIAFWRLITSATNAGAMVDGRFRPYHGMPEWHILLVGGLIMVVIGLSALIVTYRSVRGPGA